MTDDTFDDGLVHGHHWATEKPHHTAQPQMMQMDEYDDGLVHSHDWAASGN